MNTSNNKKSLITPSLVIVVALFDSLAGLAYFYGPKAICPLAYTGFAFVGLAIISIFILGRKMFPKNSLVHILISCIGLILHLAFHIMMVKLTGDVTLGFYNATKGVGITGVLTAAFALYGIFGATNAPGVCYAIGYFISCSVMSCLLLFLVDSSVISAMKAAVFSGLAIQLISLGFAVQLRLKQIRSTKNSSDAQLVLRA